MGPIAIRSNRRKDAATDQFPNGRKWKPVVEIAEETNSNDRRSDDWESLFVQK
jgi:hypothetical protein